jgi:hypothetical protein
MTQFFAGKIMRIELQSLDGTFFCFIDQVQSCSNALII